MPLNLFNYQNSFNVYALLCQDKDGPGYIKFGYSTQITQRISSLRVGCPIPIKYIALAKMATLAEMRTVEKNLHREFKDRKVTGEWFRFDFSDKKDKKVFNEGCSKVFQKNMKKPVWWEKTKMSILDKLAEQRKYEFLHSKHRNKIINKAMRARRSVTARKELDNYGY